MTSRQVRTIVNGAAVERAVEPRRLLADFLREDLGLYGTKVSCGVQVCGACTVLLDGAPVSSCTFLAVDIEGSEVTTVEGLADDGELSAVQRAFVEESALQCGFCTPGFVVAVTALLDESPDPPDEEVGEDLEGNLCRCTGYVQILAAVRNAARAGRKELDHG